MFFFIFIFHTVNSVLRVWVYYYDQCNWTGDLGNITMAVFDNPGCEGNPLQEKVTERGGDQTFLLRVEHTENWSIRVSKEGYNTVCQDIGMMIPYQSNYANIRLRQDAKVVPTASIDFSYYTGIDMSTTVFVQSTPDSCTNTSVSFRTPRNSSTSTKPFTSATTHTTIMSSQKYKDYDF